MILMLPSGSKIHQHIFLEEKEASEHDYHFKHTKVMNKIRFVSLKHALELSSANSNH